MPQWVERVVQEDLNVGTGEVWLKAPGGGEILSTQIGLHSVARGQKAYTTTWAPGAIAAGGKASTTVTVPDSDIGDFVLASHDKVLTSALRITGHINADGAARVVIHNPTSASVTVASGTLSVLVLPVRTGLTAFGLVDGLVVALAGATVSVAATDMILANGDYNSFGISESPAGPFAATADIGCPIGAKTVYLEGRSGGGYPLVQTGTFTLTDPLGFCP